MTPHPNAPPTDAAMTLPPPQNLDAERAVLAALMLGADLPTLAPEAFYRTSHQQVYRAIVALRERGEPSDGVTVSAELRTRGDLDAVGGMPALSHLMEYASSTLNTSAHARIVAQMAARRRLRDLGTQLSQDATDPSRAIPDALERVRAAMTAVTEGLTDEREVHELARLALPGPAFMACEFKQPLSMLGDSLLCEGGGAFLHAPGGEGKSFLGEQFAYAMASGTHWLGQFSAPEGGTPVVLIQAELSSYHVQARRRLDPIYRQSPPNLHTLTYEHIGHQLDILQDGDLAKVVHLIQTVGARILVLDPLSQFHSEAESPEGFKRVRTAVQAIQLRTGASVFLVHHEVKVTDPKNPRPSAARSRGATILTEDWAELGMALERDPAGHHRLHFDKCRHSAKPADVYIKQGPHGWWEGTSAPVAIGDKTTEALEKALLVCGDKGLGKDELIAASKSGGGARSWQAIKDALDRIALKRGFDDRKALNVGSDSRPRFAHVSASASLVQVEADLHYPDTDTATRYEDGEF
jgi:hypothetical protein